MEYCEVCFCVHYYLVRGCRCQGRKVKGIQYMLFQSGMPVYISKAIDESFHCSTVILGIFLLLLSVL